MARLTSSAFSAALLALAACGEASDIAGTEDATVATASASASEANEIDPKVAAEMAKAKELAAANDAFKSDYEAARAANDELKLDDLADAGNTHALYDRALRRLQSEDYMLQQGGHDDMQLAAEQGSPEAQLWIGERMAFGREGYKLQPSSGLKMMEKAAAQGKIEAILAVASMYAQDAYMHDKKKARDWYGRAAEMGNEEAKSWLDTLDAAEPPAN
jgi:TPR repeat protein